MIKLIERIKIDTDAVINVGDLYLAIRNTGWKLLTAREIRDGFIVPEEIAYCYDIHECFKVVE